MRFSSITNKLSQYGLDIALPAKTQQTPSAKPEEPTAHISFSPSKFKSAMQTKLMKVYIEAKYARTPTQIMERTELSAMIANRNVSKSEFSRKLGSFSRSELEAPDESGLTLASQAVLHGNFDAISLLSRKGVDFNAPNNLEVLQHNVAKIWDAKENGVDLDATGDEANGAKNFDALRMLSHLGVHDTRIGTDFGSAHSMQVSDAKQRSAYFAQVDAMPQTNAGQATPARMEEPVGDVNHSAS